MSFEHPVHYLFFAPYATLEPQAVATRSHDTHSQEDDRPGFGWGLRIERASRLGKRNKRGADTKPLWRSKERRIHASRITIARLGAKKEGQSVDRTPSVRGGSLAGPRSRQASRHKAGPALRLQADLEEACWMAPLHAVRGVQEGDTVDGHSHVRPPYRAEAEIAPAQHGAGGRPPAGEGGRAAVERHRGSWFTASGRTRSSSSSTISPRKTMF